MKRRRHYAYELTAAARQASLDQTRAEGGDAERRFNALCTQLLRKMPADHAALKATIRELRDCHWAHEHAAMLLTSAHAHREATADRLHLPLAELFTLAQTVEYRYDRTQRKHRPYIDLALSYVSHSINVAILLLTVLLNAKALQITGDAAAQREDEAA